MAQTVKEIIEKLQQFPADAEVQIGHFSAFLDQDLKSTRGVVTEREAYELFPADYVEYGEFYEDAWNSNPKGYFKRKCVLISSG